MKYACIILALLALPLSGRADTPEQPAAPSPATDLSLYDSNDLQLEGQLDEAKTKARTGDSAAAQQVYTRYAVAGKTEQARAWAAFYTDLLTQQAEGGDTRAMMTLAANYMGGKDYTELDREKAVAWLYRATDAGEPSAAYLLGNYFTEYGNKASGDEFYRKAYEMYSRLAAENTNALFWQGYMEQMGQGTEKDPAVGLAKLQQAADAGNEWACLQLFKTYAQGIGTEADLGRAIGYARKLADTGKDGLMAWAVACAYLNGQGVEKDEATGEHYLDMAAAVNIAPAICLKGERLQKAGKAEEAYRFFNQAASMGEPYAMVAAGRMLLYGEGTEKDEARGLKLLQSACDHYDSPAAPYELGLYYDSIDEPQLANSWYAVASERGVTEAMARRGLLHINPASGLTWSPTLMYRWWSTGSKAGDPTCTLYLRLFLYGFIPLVLILAFGVPLFIVSRLNKKAQKEEEASHAAK